MVHSSGFYAGLAANTLGFGLALAEMRQTFGYSHSAKKA
jgi:hypothetical protein